MKKLFLLLTLVAANKLMAQGTSNLIVFAEQGEKFWLVLNGVKQNQDPQTNVKVTGLNAPNYKAKIIFEDNNLPDLDENVYLMNGADPMAGEYTYNIKKNSKGKYVFRGVSAVPIAQALPPSPGQTVIVYGIPAGQVVRQTTTTTTTTGNPDNANMNMNVGGAGVSVNVHNGTSGTTTYTETHTTTTTTGYGGNTTTTTQYVPGYNGPVGCPMPMDLSSFDAAKASIQKRDFESGKADLAKTIINNNCLTTAQVKEMLGLFDFEATKLDVAKYAYPHTYDKANYFQVNDVFQFDSSTSELNKFVGSH